MKKVVADASPLIFLAKIGQLDLLADYEVYVPQQVRYEILKGQQRGKEDAAGLIRFFEGSGVRLVECRIKTELPMALGEGEKAAISYALEQSIRDIWLDEARARRVARLHKLTPKGTLGILWEAHRRGRMSSERLEEQIFELVKKGYRISEEVLIKALEMIHKPGG